MTHKSCRPSGLPADFDQPSQGGLGGNALLIGNGGTGGLLVGLNGMHGLS
jgi:hypothetical protein